MSVLNEPIHLDEIPAIPWKNGGGVTRTLAVSPADSGLDDFAWRVSIADVATSGPFSVFPGIDRTILLLSGNGMTLRSTADETIRLEAPFVPRSFAGETAIHAQLTNGPVRDFNLMIRRNIARGEVRCFTTESTIESGSDGVFYCAAGHFSIVHGERRLTMPKGTVLRLNDAQADMRIVPTTSNAVLLGAFVYVDAGLAVSTEY
jgi:environmental stress-induced protein Ves